jgi:micrococcal nuclease
MKCIKVFTIFLFLSLFLGMFSQSADAHRGARDELGGHFRRADCMYLLHEPTSIAQQAKTKEELVQLIKKYNSNSECVGQLTPDKIDLEGHTLGGSTQSNSSSSTSTQKPKSSSTNQGLVVGKKYPATLSRCVDGDTAYFTVNGKTYATRFLFIDTPESTTTVEPYGKEASNFTCSFLKSGSITLETDGGSLFDKYGRLLAWVWVGNKLHQEEIAKAGLVEDFYDFGTYKYEERVRQALATAQRNGVGMYKNEVAATSSSESTNQSNEQKQPEPSKGNQGTETTEETKKSTEETNKKDDNTSNKEENNKDTTSTKTTTEELGTNKTIFYLFILALVILFFNIPRLKASAGIRPLMAHRLRLKKTKWNILLGILYLGLWPLILIIVMIEFIHYLKSKSEMN